MNNYTVPYVFTPGTKAKAHEVNENFKTCIDAINCKYDLQGDETKNISVADGTESKHAVNKSQLEQSQLNMKKDIVLSGLPFTVKSGNTTNGKGDLLVASGQSIEFKVGSSYLSLVLINTAGNEFSVNSLTSIDMTGKPNGSYNIFVNKDTGAYALKNTIYRQPNRPTMVDDDVWLDYSNIPLRALVYKENEDKEFLDVPIGSIEKSDSGLINVITFAFNQNGNNVSFSTQGYRMPDYLNETDKIYNTVYKAECDGWLCTSGQLAAGGELSLVTSSKEDMTSPVLLWVFSSNIPGGAMRQGGVSPITKGMYYKPAAYGAIISYTAKFYPAKGAQ